VLDKPVRSEGLDINPVSDGYVIYDAANDRVHYLNHTAAVVLEWCNGEHTTADIARMLQDAFALDELPDEEAARCVAQLRDEGLVRVSDR